MRSKEDSVADSSVKSGRGDTGMNDRRLRFWVLLSLIVVVSFTVRLAAIAYWRTGAIENEGAEYARLAENLRNGVGFVGIAMPGTQLLLTRFSLCLSPPPHLRI